MKMSEGFSLPVYCVYDENKVPFQINDSYGDLLIDGESTCDETNYELIAHAINNHDRLAKENQQLREALSESQNVMNTLGLIMFNGKYSKNEKLDRINRMIGVHMNDIYTSNKQLLSQLEAKDE